MAAAVMVAGCSGGSTASRATVTTTTHRSGTTSTSAAAPSTSIPARSTTTTTSTTSTTSVTPSSTVPASTTSSIPFVTTTTAAPGSTPLPVGQYFNAPSGGPRYDLSVTSARGDQVSGQLSFIYQDGRTSPVFSFQGTVAANEPFLLHTSPAMTAYAVVSKGTVSLVDCNNYLQYASSSAACLFTG